MKVQYLEIVTRDVEGVCDVLESVDGATFGGPVEALGNARTAQRGDGSMIGVRAPMSDSEEPVTRAYWLVDDIEKALNHVVESGGEIAHPPLTLDGYGTFAIYFLGGTQHGFWQL